MKSVQLNLPDEAHVVGDLYGPDDPALLKEGMLHVAVAGVAIDVSWHPEHDLSGAYLLSVYEGSWENQIRDQMESRDVHEIAAVVERTVNELLQAHLAANP